MIPELERLGFTRNEANVYLAALRLGKCSVQQLASTTGLNRITVHGIVEKFEGIQVFLRTYEGKRRRVTPVDPSRLQFLLKREEESVQSKQVALQTIFPSLQELFQKTQRGLEVLTFQGEEGYRRICDDVLQSTTEILEYANIDHLTKAIGGYLQSDYLPTKHKLKLKTKFLFVDTAGARKYIKENYMQPNRAPMEVKFIDSKVFNIDTYLVIYGEKVALLTPSNMNAVIIKDKAVSDSLRPFFNFVWDRAGEALSNN